MVVQKSTCDFLGKTSRFWGAKKLPERCRSDDVLIAFRRRSDVVQMSVQVAFTGAILNRLNFRF